jgi:hypothetical protein
MSTSLSHAHAVLVAALQSKPVAAARQATESWLALSLAKPGLQADGETDLTVFLSHLPEENDLFPAAQADRAAWILAQLDQLTAHTSLFEANAKGVTGWDLLQTQEHPLITQWWLERPDCPPLSDLMRRRPLGEHAQKQKAPTVWAAWAARDRQDDLRAVHEAGRSQGLAWPTDLLGWAHPALVKYLLSWGVPMGSTVPAIWADRQRRGLLDQAEVNRMQHRCASALGLDLNAVQGAAWRQGADVVKTLKETKDLTNWQGLLASAGNISAFTAPYVVMTPEGKQRQAVPLLVRLLALMVSNELTQSKMPDFIRFLAEDFERLAGDPTQLAPGTPYALGTVAHMLAVHQENEVVRRTDLRAASQAAQLQTVRALQARITAWAGPMNWTTSVACADDLDHQGLLFSNAWAQHSFPASLNAVGFRRAEEHLSAPGFDPKAENPWVTWAVARVVTPNQHQGFWNQEQLLRVVDPDHRVSAYASVPFGALARHLTPPQRVQAVMALFLDRTSNLALTASPRQMCARYLQRAWSQVSDTEQADFLPQLQALAEGQGQACADVMTVARQTLGAWTANDRQEQAQDHTPGRRRSRMRA